MKKYRILLSYHNGREESYEINEDKLGEVKAKALHDPSIESCLFYQTGYKIVREVEKNVKKKS